MAASVCRTMRSKVPCKRSSFESGIRRSCVMTTEAYPCFCGRATGKGTKGIREKFRGAENGAHGSFVPQGDHGIDAGSAAGGEIAGGQANYCDDGRYRAESPCIRDRDARNFTGQETCDCVTDQETDSNASGDKPETCC